MGYERVEKCNEADLVKNLKVQLEKHNRIQLTNDEFEQIKDKLKKGDVFDKARMLRGRIDVIGADGIPKYIELVSEHHRRSRSLCLCSKGCFLHTILHSV